MTRMTLASLVLTLLAGTTPAPTLTARLENDTVDYAAPIAVLVAFENRSKETVRYHEPPHARSITFPSLRFVNVETGDAWVPYTAPFQTAGTRGNVTRMQGKVVEMLPTGRRVYRIVRDRFGPVDRVLGKADGKDKVPLPPGTYRVEAAYERTSDKVTYWTGTHKLFEKRSVPGLFVGKIEAEPVTVTVRRPDRPRVEIAPAKDGTPSVWLTFDNPTAKDWTFAGRPELVVTSKAYGAGTARPAILSNGDMKEGEQLQIEVPAGERRRFKVRLRALSFGSRKGGPCGLGEIIPQGLAQVRFRLGGAKSPANCFETDGIFIRIPPPKHEGIDALRVMVKAPEEAKAGEAVSLEIEIVNGGKKDALILHRLAFPRDVMIRIQDAAGKRPMIGSVSRTAGGLDSLRPGGEVMSKVAEGLTWDGDAFDKAPGITRKDFVAIEPGDGIAKTFDLGKRLAKGLTPGTYRITVGYRNYESGERLGFAKEHRAPTGIVWSKPVVLIVR